MWRPCTDLDVWLLALCIDDDDDDDDNDDDNDDDDDAPTSRNTRDLGSFGEETDKIMDLHQIHEEVLLTERGDGVAGIKRGRRDPSSDGV
ncbi:hypothetical protein Tco_1276463 [Tanacetum coccineum]